MSLIIQKWCTCLKMKVNFLIIKENVKSTGQTEKVDSIHPNVRETFPGNGGLGKILRAMPHELTNMSLIWLDFDLFAWLWFSVSLLYLVFLLFQWSELPRPSV